MFLYGSGAFFSWPQTSKNPAMSLHLIAPLLLASMLVQAPSLAQAPTNLVVNPGFEELLPASDFGPCEYNKSAVRFGKAVENWTTFDGLTPDLIIWKEGCPYPKPHGGNQMVGLITYHPGVDIGRRYDFHEFVQGKLAAPMVPGTTYVLEFYVHQNDQIAADHLQSVYGRKQEIMPTAAGNIGVYLTRTMIPAVEDMGQNVLHEAIFPQANHSEPIVTAVGVWSKISFTFTADVPYQYFTIGNFKKDADTPNLLTNNAEIETFNLATGNFWSKKKRVAYYCLDDIAVYPVGKRPQANTATPSAASIAKDMREKNTYTFKNVAFESGEAELLPSSIPELDGLVAYLKENPAVRVEIVGHTDNVGGDEANLELSQRRAAAVWQYLIGQGIAQKRVQHKGKGESAPVDTNDTPAGRANNRRVECRLLGG